MFFDKKFGLPQGLIDAVMKVHEGDVIKFPGKKKIPINDKGEKTSVPVKKETPSTKDMKQYFKDNVKEAFKANPKMAHHYEKGPLGATVMADMDEHGNQDGHKVHFFKNGKKQESKTYHTDDEADAHDAAKQYVSQGLNSVHKEEVTFSEAELAHINELLVPNADKVEASSVGDYFNKRSNSRLDNNKTPFSSAKPAKLTSDKSGPKKTLALPKPEAKPATHSAGPMVQAHHDMHAPKQKGTKPTTLTLTPKVSTSAAAAAAAISARQRANSFGNLKGKSIENTDASDVRDPMHSDKTYDDWKAKQSGVGTKTLPTTASKPAVATTADPKPTQTGTSIGIQKVSYTLPAGTSKVQPAKPAKAAKPAKEPKGTPGKKQAGTGKVVGAGKKPADLTPSVKPTSEKAPRNVHPKFEEGQGVSHYTSALGTAHGAGNSADYGSSLKSLSANKKMKVGDVRDVVAKLTKHPEASKMTRAKAVEHLAQHYESKHGKLAEEYLIFFEQELLDTFSDKELEFITGYYQGNE